jgi:transcriptional regulator with XRE-family HTH domain
MDIKKTVYTGQYKSIIQNLKEARGEQGLTQQEVAKHFGVGQSFISKIETGQYRLDILQLQEFAKLYKKPLTSFLKEQ